MPSDLSRRSALQLGLYSSAALLFSGCKEVVLLGQDPPTNDWAAGGTASMTDKANYPDPFAIAPASCALLCETTPGPCTTSNTPIRQDVSEGEAGLPVRLALKIVREDCSPVAGATVEIWHTHKKGVYSGLTPALAFCTNGDEDAPNHMWFRGVQQTDANGRVNFDTCFPGWYPGRSIHIHVQIKIGATTFATSQLFFDEALTQEIFAAHPEYQDFGQPDTVQSTDGVLVGAGDIADYILDVAQMTDGAMLASKVLTIRENIAQPGCDL
jgi:protocatechuate 3,4-dioxygenase beta subunit